MGGGVRVLRWRQVNDSSQSLAMRSQALGHDAGTRPYAAVLDSTRACYGMFTSLVKDISLRISPSQSRTEPIRCQASGVNPNSFDCVRLRICPLVLSLSLSCPITHSMRDPHGAFLRFRRRTQSFRRSPWKVAGWHRHNSCPMAPRRASHDRLSLTRQLGRIQATSIHERLLRFVTDIADSSIACLRGHLL